MLRRLWRDFRRSFWQGYDAKRRQQRITATAKQLQRDVPGAPYSACVFYAEQVESLLYGDGDLHGEAPSGIACIHAESQAPSIQEDTWVAPPSRRIH